MSLPQFHLRQYDKAVCVRNIDFLIKMELFGNTNTTTTQMALDA